MTKLNSRARVVAQTGATLKRGAAALCLFLFAACAGAEARAASVLSMTGPVTFETYQFSSPFSAPAASVAISFAFDETIPLDTGGAIPGAFIAFFDSAALSAKIDVLDASGTLLGSYAAPDPFLQITNRSADATPDQLRLTSGDGGLPGGSPFETFEIFLEGDGSMFATPGLDQITAEALQNATLFAQGSLAIPMIGEGSAGIVFAPDLASIALERKTDTPAPVPAPPALISLLLGLAGFGILGRPSRRRAPVT